jgi:hypothetical protein
MTLEQLASVLTIASEAKIAQSRAIVWSAAERPVVFALPFGDRCVVYVGDAPPHQTVDVELPVLVP